MELQEIRPGLWRWTAPHPDAEPDPKPGSPADWPTDVGCVAYATDDTLVLVDPLVTDGDWAALDALADRPVSVLTTLRFHRRSSAGAIERYSASNKAPAGVEPIKIERAGETMYWIAEHNALVPGDRLLGFGATDGGLRTSPDSWHRYLRNSLTQEELKAELRTKLLGLPIELVLVSHGTPVLANGRDALAAALA